MLHSAAPPPPQDLVEPTKQAKDLPNEIIERILAFVDEHGDASTLYANCRLASRRFDHLAKPFFFAHRVYHQEKQSAGTQSQVSFKPACLELIVSLDLHDRLDLVQPSAERLVWLNIKLAARFSLENVHLSACTNLRRLGLSYPDDAAGELEDVLEAIKGLPRLHALFLYCVASFDPLSNASPLPPLLDSLFLDFVDDEAGGFAQAFSPSQCTLRAFGFKSTLDLPQQLALAHRKSLVRLDFDALHDSIQLGEFLQLATWPSLKYISVHYDDTTPWVVMKQVSSHMAKSQVDKHARLPALELIAFDDFSDYWGEVDTLKCLFCLRPALKTEPKLADKWAEILSPANPNPAAPDLVLTNLLKDSLLRTVPKFSLVPAVSVELPRYTIEMLVSMAAEARRNKAHDEDHDEVGSLRLSDLSLAVTAT